MIEFTERSIEEPLVKFYHLYSSARNKKDKSSDVAVISSFSKTRNEVNSRCVNIKFVINDKFIFFSNYDSPKSNEFKEHNQVSAIFNWRSINSQIRMKGTILKTPPSYNKAYFYNRDIYKNALSISSNQSAVISSFDEVKSKYEDVKTSRDLTKCPDYWGGFSIKMYEIEFWLGHEFRLNKRELYKKVNHSWKKFILEP